MATRRKATQARGVAKRRGSSRPKTSIERVQNDEYPLPREVAAVFDDALSHSFQAAQAEQEFQAKMAQAREELDRAQRRLADALAKQLGVAGAVQEFDTLRDRHNRTVIEAFESASSAILTAQDDTGRRGEKTRRPRR